MNSLLLGKLWKAIRRFLIFLLLAFYQPVYAMFEPALYLNGDMLGTKLGTFVNEVYDEEHAKKGIIADYNLDKYLTATLMHGKTILFDQHSKERIAVEEWLSKQPYNSIMPFEFYVKLVEITGGNVEKALILAWDFLSDGWIYAVSRNLDDVKARLADITGEKSAFDGSQHFRPKILPNGQFKKDNDGIVELEFVVTKRGDNFSAWYHFAGVAISAYNSANFFPRISQLKSKLYVHLERLLYLQTSGLGSKKRINLGLAGADFGYRLRKIISEKRTGNRGTKTYLDLLNKSELEIRPDIYKPRYYLQPNQKPKDYGMDADKVNNYYESLDYLKSVFKTYHLSRPSEPTYEFNDLLNVIDRRRSANGDPRALILNPIRLFLTSEGLHIVRLLESYSKSPSDASLNLLIKETWGKHNMKEADIERYIRHSGGSALDLHINIDNVPEEYRLNIVSGVRRFFKAVDSIITTKSRCQEFYR